MISRLNVCSLLSFREKVLDLRPKSVCAVEMTMYVYCTYIIILYYIILLNMNRKDVHA